MTIGGGSAAERQPEPWLRGPVAGVHPLVMPVFHSFQQVREDLAHHTDGLADADVWRELGDASLGFHLRHLAGSVDRLTTYLADRQLSPAQLRALQDESQPSGTLRELLAAIDRQLSASEEKLRILDPSTIYDDRSVGRLALPATVLGLLVHLCEHTQRHLGQAVTLARLLKQQV